ncbi:MAG: radical SAM family heme chaperone HemW [Clostridia bacterium]|nr:radical SAM family heme chaperone HemW [Clostridia bacterium]
MNDFKGLYIHIPFCIRKCKYCDFVSYCGQEENYDLYIEKLSEEAEEFKGENIDSVFIGGGTPTILSSAQLSKLLRTINNNFNISPDCEFSIEANPKTLDKEKLQILKYGGVNRISVGVQSFCDEELKKIGRIHNAENAYNTLVMIKDAGFENLNIDLMLSLPGQNEDSLLKTLNRAMEISPTHISCYSLILEEGTRLFEEYQSGIYSETDDDYDRYLYHMTIDYLKKHGYDRYEISNFSKPGFQCRHNIKYWNCDEYIGLGTAAHSYYDSRRTYNTSKLSEYLKGNFHSDDITFLDREDKIKEYIIMRLRLAEGINENDFFMRFHEKFSDRYTAVTDKLIKLGLMSKDKNNYFLTERGTDISNSVMCEFL